MSYQYAKAGECKNAFQNRDWSLKHEVMEAERRVSFQKVDGSAKHFTLNEGQWEAFRAIYRGGARYVGLGGAGRSGKSWFSVGFLPVYLSLIYPHNVGIISRNTFKECRTLILEEILEKFFLDEIVPGYWKFIKEDQTIKFDEEVGGSKIIFQNVRDTHNRKVDINKTLMGRGIGWFSVDQSEFISEADYNTYKHRMSMDVTRPVGVVNFNPRGHDWNWKCFVNEATRNKDTLFIHYTTDVNKANLSSQYMEDIKKMHPAWKKKWVDGSFESWEGLIYPMFSEKTHVVPPISKEFFRGSKHKIYVSIDYGLNNPTSIGFFTILEGGTLLRFDEHYERGLFVPDVYEVVYKILTNRWGLEKMNGYTIMDKTFLHKRDSNRGITAAMIFAEEDRKRGNFGLIPYPSTGEVLVGINRMGGYLVVDPEATNPITQAKGSPRLLVCSNCEKWRWEVSQYCWKESPNLEVDINTAPDIMNLKEEPINKNNHAMDDTRYLIMTLPPVQITGTLNSAYQEKTYLSGVTKY